MTDELEKFKTAFGILHNHISAQIALGHLCGGAKSEAGNVLQLAVATIHPPPEFEEVEVVRWYNIYPLTDGFHLDYTHGFATKEEADNDAGTERIGCQDIRVKVKRPVKRPVEKEVSVEGVEINPNGGFRNWPGRSDSGRCILEGTDAAGKTVTLIARWTE